MKTVFITVSDGEVSKNILRSDIFRLLKNRVKMVLFVNKNKLDYFLREFGSETVRIETIPKPTFPRLEEVFSDVFLYSLHTKSIWVKIEHSYASGGSLAAKWIKKALWFLGQFFIFRQFWRILYSIVLDRSFGQVLDREKPNLVFAANLISNEDSRLLKAAKKRNIKALGMPKGWDNLTLKTFLAVFPDRLLVQTPAMLKDAVSFLDYPKEKIEVVGFAKFDPYANRALIEPRETFLSRLGLDPNKKTILYAGAGDQLAPHDEEVLRDFLMAIQKGEVNTPVQLIVRPHPKYRYQTEVIPPSSLWVYDRPGKVVGVRESDFEFDEADITHLMNSLAHSDLLVHTVSTLGIEAAIFDKPSITIGFDGNHHSPYGLSVRRYFDYVHLDRVIKTGGMRIASSPQELVSLTNEYLKHPEKDREARKRMAIENAHVIDGKAGERAAGAILQYLEAETQL